MVRKKTPGGRRGGRGQEKSKEKHLGVKNKESGAVIQEVAGE